MIKRLRRKFILINMGLVALVLLIVMGMSCFSAYHRQQLESEMLLLRVMDRPGDMGFDERKPDFSRGPRRETIMLLPAFRVISDAQGSITSKPDANVTVSDEVLQEAVEEALKSEQDKGVIPALGLRYLRRALSGGGHQIAFVDRSNELSVLRGQIATSLLVTGIALLAFFVISLFLSRWAIRPIARSWEQQRQFVADASHELKTPLTVILANADILLAHPQARIEEEVKWVQNTKDEALRMKKLVDDLLFLAKSDADRKPPVLSPLNLSDLVWSSLLPFESVAFERGVALNAEIEPGLCVPGSESRLMQLVAILLDNACKYADPGTAITAALSRQQDTAVLRITNRGNVIAPEELAHIFERFYRADKSRVHQEGGYGLGLAIAKTIADEHKAKLSAQSDAEQGTVFTLSIELVR